MLSVTATDISGREVILSTPLYLNIRIDETVPADAFYGVFAMQKTEELMTVTVYDDGRTVFRGVVDEEERALGGSGLQLRISARSQVALLLDNEAAPCGYDHPTAEFIYQRYAAPYGLKNGDADATMYFGEQSIVKGASCWSVIRRFSLACFSALPRVSADGVLYMKGMQKDDKVRFGTDGVRYTRLSEVHKHCEEISAVYLKTAAAGSYDFPIENEQAIRRGIRRTRFLNAVLTESPMRCAQKMLENGARKAYAVQLRCPGCLLGVEGSRASVSDAALGDTDGLYISALQYRMNTHGDYTDVTLKRRINGCGSANI